MSFLSRLHEELRRARLTRKGATHAPEQVPTGTYKTYPRMERIFLDRTPPAGSFADAVRKRRSARDLDTTPLSSDAVSAVFLSLSKHVGSARRSYPSGGALYPIETYFIAERFNEYERGVFHYDPAAHALEYLWKLPSGDLKQLVKRPDDLFFPSLVVFTAVWRRSSMKYGDLAYQHALLEAGHMSQNVLLSAAALDIAARPMAGFDDDALIEAFDIDAREEQPVHTILLGPRALRENDAVPWEA